MVSLNLSFGNDSMREVDIDNDRFYKMMASNGIPTSSQPSVGDMYQEMLDVISWISDQSSDCMLDQVK